MKNLYLALMLAFSTHAFAKYKYECQVEGTRNIREVRALKLPNFDSEGYFPINKKACQSKPGRGYTDVCKINKHTVVIGKDLTESFLITDKNKIYEFSCWELQQQQQEQQEQESPDGGEQQEQEPQHGPGHGGSTSGPRG